MVPKVILRLGFVDLTDHVASSILTQLRESSVPSGRALRSFHTYRFLNESCRQCVVENDCM